MTSPEQLQQDIEGLQEQGASAEPPLSHGSAAEPVPVSGKAGIANAGDLAQRCVEGLNPERFAPFVKKLSDDLYESLMNDVQDYLIENCEHNIATRLAAAEGEASRLRAEMWEIDRALSGASWQGTRAEQITMLETTRSQFTTLLYAVASKHPGEDRFATALRYIRERERGNSDASAKAGASC